MRAARRCLAALVVLVLLAGIPGAVQASAGQGTVEADLPTLLSGRIVADARQADLLVPEGAVQGHLEGHGRLLVTVVTYEERYRVEGIRTDQVSFEFVSSERKTRDYHLSGGSLDMVGEEATLLVRSAERLTTRIDGEVVEPERLRWDRDVTAVLHASEGHDVRPPTIGDADAYHAHIRPGTFGLYADAMDATATGALRAYVFDADLTLTPADGEATTVETGRALYREDAESRLRHEVPLGEPGAGKPSGGAPLPDGPMWHGGGGHVFAVHTTTYALIQARPLDGPSPVLTLQASSPQQVTAFSDDVEVGLLGSVRLDHAVGQLEVDDRVWEFDGQEVMISGALQLTPQPNARGAHGGSVPYSVEGDVAYLRVGDVAHDLAADPMVAIVIGLAVGAAGIMVYLWPLLKFGLFNLLGAPFYSRFRKDEVLRHDVRSDIYDIIESDPGISISRVAERADVGWGTAVYHLNVLEENGLVVSMRDGRYKRYYQNGGRYNGKKEALAAIRNDTTRKVVDAVLHNPGITQTGLCDQLGISAPLAHWHLNRLKEADVVEQERDGRYKRHYVTDRSRDVLQAHM